MASSKMRLAVSAAVLALGAAMPASAQNIVTNGGFDADPVPVGGFTQYDDGQTIGGGGWTVFGAAGNAGLNINTNYSEAGVSFPAQAGVNAFDLTAAGNTGRNGVFQSLATVVGQAYRLSFFVGNATGDGSGNSGVYTLPSSLSVSLAGGAPQIFTNANVTLGSVNWQQFSLNFIATTAATDLRFFNETSGDNFVGLDSVSVAAVPEPATWGMMILGFGAMGFAMRRRKDVRTTVRFA